MIIIFLRSGDKLWNLKKTIQITRCGCEELGVPQKFRLGSSLEGEEQKNAATTRRRINNAD
jgi:hypothetical protein